MDSISFQPGAGILFSESAFAPREECFRRKRRRKIDREADPDSLAGRLRRVFYFEQEEAEGVPLVCLGYEGVMASEEKSGLLEGEGGRREVKARKETGNRR